MNTPHRKFTFDTVFDAAGAVAYAPPPQRRVYTLAEVEAIRAQAFAEGEASTVARAEADQAIALGQIAQATRAALSALAEAAHNHRVLASELALAAAQVVAGAALDRFPEAPVAAALEALAREVEAAPRLKVRAAAGLAERTQTALDAVAEACGFPGQITVQADPALPRAAFMLDWGEGRASYDPLDAQARVAEAVRSALIAEGLHAEPLLPNPHLASET